MVQVSFGPVFLGPVDATAIPESLLKVAERADRFFTGTSNIHQAMQRLAKAMSDMRIPFAIAGAMADVMNLIRINQLPLVPRFKGKGILGLQYWARCIRASGYRQRRTGRLHG